MKAKVDMYVYEFIKNKETLFFSLKYFIYRN